MLPPGAGFSKAQLGRDEPNCLSGWVGISTPPASSVVEPAPSLEVRSAIFCTSRGSGGPQAGVTGDDNSQMGADLLSGVDRRRYPRLHVDIKGFSRHPPLP